MKFKSEVITQASGSIGGVTYAHNQGGLYRRARSIPTNPNTALQQVIREAMLSAHIAWKALTEAVRNEWKAYAAATEVVGPLGDPINIGGLAMFLRQFIHRAQCGVAQITTAPALAGLAQLSATSVARHLVQDAFDLTYEATDEWCTATGGYLAVYQSAPQIPTKSFFKGPYRYAGKQPGNTGAPPASPFFFTSLWALTAGQRYFFRVIAVDSTGRLSAQQFLQCDVA